ncbi:trichodiene oxygenase [Xylariaceae sp. FL0804]|nr:trichodiene oxygenase [Xylariaceae sp. FL0804]
MASPVVNNSSSQPLEGTDSESLLQAATGLSWYHFVLLGGLYYSSIAFYRLYLSPLSKIPGPKLAAITRWYEAWYDVILNGQYTFRIQDMHRKYGPIIRISPWEVHVSDPAFFEQLYRQDGRWDKYAWAFDAIGVPGATAGTVSHEVHKGRRAPLNHFFSKPNMTRFQPTVERQIETLCCRLDGFVESRKLVNLNMALSAFTRDVSSSLIIGKSYENITKADLTGLKDTGGGMHHLWGIKKHFPWLGTLITYLPFSVADRMTSNGNEARFNFFQHMGQVTQELMAKATSETPDPDAPHTVVHAIVQSKLPESEKAFGRLIQDTAAVSHAGLETVASVQRIILYYVYSNPPMLRRLRAELRDAAGGRLANEAARQYAVGPLGWSALQQLPYLTGVLYEALRLSPGLATRMARIAPDRELVYDKYHIPAGTPVGMTALLMHWDENLYPDPKRFEPERWLDLDVRKKAEKTWVPFSRGTRSCVGMHLAWSELYLLTAAFVLRYDVKLVGAGPKDVEPAFDHAEPGNKDESGIQARLRFAES